MARGGGGAESCTTGHHIDGRSSHTCTPYVEELFGFAHDHDDRTRRDVLQVLDIFEELPPVRIRSFAYHVRVEVGGPQAMSTAKVALGRRLVEHEVQDTLGANDFELSGHARARGRVEEWKRPP